MGNYVSQAIEPAERVFCYFLVKIIAVVFDFYSSASWGEKEIFTKGVSDGQKRGGGGVTLQARWSRKSVQTGL